VSTTYPLGYFREDYGYVAPTPSTPDYLDEHNGRFCVTPEYPGGTYAYFCTVDANWNSAYPYAVGPTFYGVKTAAKVTSITEPVTVYTPSTSSIENNDPRFSQVTIFPNPSGEFIAIQINDINRSEVSVELFDMTGKRINTTSIHPGSTITYFDIRTLYNGEYIVRLTSDGNIVTGKISVSR
jgi:hypothetical protein